MIENVVCLASKLEPHSFAKHKCFRESKIDASRWRTFYYAAARISRDIARRNSGETTSFEIFLRSFRSELIGVTRHVWPSSRVSINKARSRRIEIRCGDSKWKPGLISSNTRQLPSAENLADKSLLILEERQLVNVVD